MNRFRKSMAIVNPSAAGGRAGKRWPQIQKSLSERLGQVDSRFTRARSHAIELTAQALDDGYDLIIAVGGDGTVNEIVNGFFRKGEVIRPSARLGLIPIGTGGDLQRTLRIPLDAAQAVDVLVSGDEFPIDVGHARLKGYNGKSVERYFLNLLSFGMGGDVSVRAKSFPRWIGGKGAFLGATLLVFLSYSGKRVRLTLDGTALPDEFLITNIAVGNGRFHGGGMHPCPRAVMNDGWLEVTTIDRLSMFELIRDLPVLYSDDVYQHPKVRHFRGRKVVADSPDVTRVEIDGEALGVLPLEVEILPRKIRILMGPEGPLVSSGDWAPAPDYLADNPEE